MASGNIQKPNENFILFSFPVNFSSTSGWISWGNIKYIPVSESVSISGTIRGAIVTYVNSFNNIPNGDAWVCLTKVTNSTIGFSVCRGTEGNANGTVDVVVFVE